MTPRAAFLALTAAASVRAAGFLDQGCATSQSQSGSSWALDGSRLSAHCNDHICGEQAHTVLDLNLCLGNDQGKLVARKNGNYADSCRDCLVSNDGGSLVCACDVSKGITRVSQFDLKADNTIYNWYGHLSCFGAHGDETTPRDVSHCSAAAPAAGVKDPLSCDGCVSAPVGALGSQHDQVGKTAIKAGGRRAVVRPQWRTQAVVVDDSIQAPAVHQVQAAQKQDDGVKAQQEPRGVLTQPQVQAAQQQDGIVQAQQEPRGVLTQPQVKVPAVNEDTQGSFHARRSSNAAQGETSADATQSDPAIQVQAAYAKIQDPRPDGVQAIDSHIMNPVEHAAHIHAIIASQQARRSSTSGPVEAAASVYGQFPRPVTDQRQVEDVQDASSGHQQGAKAQQIMPKKSHVTHLGGGPVEGMGPAVQVVDSRQ